MMGIAALHPSYEFWSAIEESARYDNPAYESIPPNKVGFFARQMLRHTTTVEDIRKFRSLHWQDRRGICEQLLNNFRQALKDYPAGDPNKLRKELGSEEYLKLVDEESKQDNPDANRRSAAVDASPIRFVRGQMKRQ